MSAGAPFTCRGVRAKKRWAIGTMIAMLFSTTGGPALVPAVQAQAPAVPAQSPVGQGFTIEASDLRFIMRQIRVAESHAAGNPLVGAGLLQIASTQDPRGLRTVDGTLNHILPGAERFGAADRVFPRLAQPNFVAAENGSSYRQKKGTVTDSEPRVISNLVVDQTASNPAVVAAAARAGASGVPDASGSIFIPNIAPDVGLSAPFNTMFVFFGQFFDHGLDLLTKGGGTVFVPLRPGDPLFVQGSPTNFMALTRATNQPGFDGILGDDPATPDVDESADDVQEGTNTTTPWVDQNQTYTSHPSHQVFLRQYTLNAAGRPVSTGRMIDGIGGNIGNWHEVKEQAAAMLGIGLVDADVFNVPLLATDAYGRFLRGPNGFPLMMMADNTVVEGDPGAPISTAGAKKTGHAFLDDIAHNAVPRPGVVPDADLVAGASNAPLTPGTYDNELLEAHFVTGDGRGNENIALTAVHTIFHSEHNRLRDDINGLINSMLTPAEIAEWTADSPQPPAGSGWDYGERLFQAARLVTEMEYQHLVFEEFGRKVQPAIRVFPGVNASIDPAISAEFAHAVYRFGHSMLTENIPRTLADGTTVNIPLLDGFLNPLAFNNLPGGAVLNARQAAGAIFQGGTREVANEIDEFITEALRNRLLGLPLDLATINLSRGRSEGVPRLNAFREQVYLATGDPALAPYMSWADFGFSIRHAESLVNFIAAYGISDPLAAETTLAGKRQVALTLSNDPNFLFGAAAATGVNNIDLWVGGLAEKQAPFGGFLGSTFNYVFQTQLERLQDADRFYYLGRLDGTNLVKQLEGNSFAELVSRNSTAVGLSADVFARPDMVFNLAAQNLTGPIVDDPGTPDVDERAQLMRMPNGTIRYNGPLHVIWNGRDDGNGDLVISGEGDDTLRGNGGRDIMEGGAGNDLFIGGDGDDILTDTFGIDTLKGGPGNDAIASGAGTDLIQGGPGKDFMSGAGGADGEVHFGGPGDDFSFGSNSTNAFQFGDSGDDWIEGNGGHDNLAGDFGSAFDIVAGADPFGGADVLIGGDGQDNSYGEGGDDIIVNAEGTDKFFGGFGFDWVAERGNVAADQDMNRAALLLLLPGALFDTFRFVEGLSGYRFNDILRGDSLVAADMLQHELTPEGVARIGGLSAILGGATSFTGGNIILGGAGSDIIEGRGGDDIIDGDAWLNVQLRAPNPATPDPDDVQLVDGMAALRADVFAGRINPGDITIVRSIVTTGVAATDVDVALFTGARAEYSIVLNGDGSRTVSHSGGARVDGTDRIRNIETLRFADGDVSLVSNPAGTVSVPNLFGLTEAAARTAIQKAGLTVGTVNGPAALRTSPTAVVGSVINQAPLASLGAPLGSAVSFSTSLGALVPDISDATVTDGGAALIAGGLVVSGQTSINDPATAVGFVVATNPVAGAIIPPGSGVLINVSLGPVVAGRVPAVAGLPRADAEAAITAAGYVVPANPGFEASATIPPGSVTRTVPAAGLARAAGTVVTPFISLGPDGLALALGFDEAGGTVAIDSSIAARNGTLRPQVAPQAPMQRAPGVFGSAMRFDGVDDWVTVTDVANSAIDLTNAMTLEAWVNPTTVLDSDTVMLKEFGAGQVTYGLYSNKGAGPAAAIRQAPAALTETEALQSATALQPGVWQHLAVTFQGAANTLGTMRIFVNGVQVAERQTEHVGNIVTNNNALRIGGNNSFAGEFFQGLIDEVRIYRTARTAAQIQQDMRTPINPR